MSMAKHGGHVLTLPTNGCHTLSPKKTDTMCCLSPLKASKADIQFLQETLPISSCIQVLHQQFALPWTWLCELASNGVGKGRR